MLKRTYQLRFHIDQDGRLGINLETSDSLLKINEFIANNFQDTKDVRKKYEVDIGEFCLDYQRRIEKENAKNGNKRLGAVSLFCREVDDDKVNYYKLPILYTSELLPKKECIKRIKNGLQDDEKINELLTKKNYLLSMNEKSLFRIYQNIHSEKYKNQGIGFLIERLNRMDLETLQFNLQSLMNLFALKNDIKKVPEKKIVPVEEREEEFTFSKPQNKPEGWSTDDLFNELIRRRDYDTIHNIYGLDFIEHNSNLLDEDTNHEKSRHI